MNNPSKELQARMIYTKAAIARLLGVTEARIVRTAIWWSGFWILIKGRSPRIYSKKLFRQHFADIRRKQSYGLGVECHGRSGRYTVKGDLTHHAVQESGSAYTCDCRDYGAIVQAFGSGCCKHIYAVLGYQGFTSLADRITNYGKEEARAIGI